MTFFAALTTALAVMVTLVWASRHVSHRWGVALAPVVAVVAYQVWKLAIAADQALLLAALSSGVTLAVALRWSSETKRTQDAEAPE